MFRFFEKKDKTRYVISSKLAPKVKTSFLDLSSKEQKSVIMKAARQADKEQAELVKSADDLCCAKS